MKKSALRAMALSLVAAVAAASPGCSSDDVGTSTNPSGGGAHQGGGDPGGQGAGSPNGVGGGVGGGFEAPPECVNLECQQVTCEGGGTTTVTGTVYAPSGTLPVYGVFVYVPNADVEPFVDGLTCDQCDSELSGSPLVTAVTDVEGRFVLENVPVGADIPLVIQIGKWRRQVTIPAVEACVDNPLTSADVTRLPKNRFEGDIPRIALTTGGCDVMQCLLRKLGIDDDEFDSVGGPGRVHLYAGQPSTTFPTYTRSTRFADGLHGGKNYASAEDLWNGGWSDYDVVLMACECETNANTKSGTMRENLESYLDMGGRVFASHWHLTWLQHSSAPAGLQSVASLTTASSDIGTVLTHIDTSFPKGEALADWLDFVGASPQYGRMEVREGRQSVNSINDPPSRRWIYNVDNQAIERAQYFSFNAPVTAAETEQCGRMVFSDMHVSEMETIDVPGAPFPSGCNTTELTPQEKALVFMLFDLSACIQPDDDPVTPPGPN